MPDVVSEAATLSLSQMEDLIEDDHHPVHGDPMLSHHLLNSPRSPSSPSSSLHSNDLNLNNHSNGRYLTFNLFLNFENFLSQYNIFAIYIFLRTVWATMG